MTSLTFTQISTGYISVIALENGGRDVALDISKALDKLIPDQDFEGTTVLNKWDGNVFACLTYVLIDYGYSSIIKYNKATINLEDMI